MDMEVLLVTAKANHLLLVVEEREGKKVAILSGKATDVVVAARALNRPATDIHPVPD